MFAEFTRSVFPAGSRWRGVLLSAMALFCVACGGGGGGSSPAAAPVATDTTPEQGLVMIGVTDAPGDFVTYRVTVDALSLTRANGDVVETLPLSTSIDFNELAEVTEFLTIATVPAGTYTSASVTLDFTDAEILVQNDAGDAVEAVAVDLNGDPLGTVVMDLMLTTSDAITVRAGRPAAFSLDFDLDASNSIDLSVTPPVVTVEPFLLATPELEADRQHRVRGLLAGVQPDQASFDLRVRPFRHRDGEFGELSVSVSDDTVYDVDGVSYTGAPGLEAMAALETGAPVVALGHVSDRAFIADEVVAGSSVPWSDTNVVRGIVVARAADALTVRGAAVQFADDRHVFRGEFTVLLNGDTTVTAPGVDDATLGTHSISVGQRIVAWGEQADDVSLVAQRVRMKFSGLTGAVVQAQPLAVDLSWLNGRNPAIYDFSGTGVAPDEDANPAFYEIETASLPLADVLVGDLVKVRGLVNAFGMAPPDFVARTVIDVETDTRAAQLQVGWPDGSAVPFVSTAPERIDLDLTEARKALKLRGVPRDFIDLAEEIALIATSSGQGIYAVKVRGAGEVHLYRSFTDLVDEAVAQLEQGRVLHHITAQGRYNGLASELTTGRAGFVFSTVEQDR